MLINGKSTELLKKRLETDREVWCSGLFLSARWFVFSAAATEGMHLIVLPDKESAEYCASDLYNLIEGDRVFFLPDTGRKIERSNYKASLEVQRTSALGKIMERSDGELTVLVSYPEALDEKVPSGDKVSSSVVSLRKGEEIDYEKLCGKLASEGFHKVDFVSEPGQYAVRGGFFRVPERDKGWYLRLFRRYHDNACQYELYRGDIPDRTLSLLARQCLLSGRREGTASGGIQGRHSQERGQYPRCHIQGGGILRRRHPRLHDGDAAFKACRDAFSGARR